MCVKETELKQIFHGITVENGEASHQLTRNRDENLRFRLPELKVPITYIKSYAKKKSEMWLKIQELNPE